MSHKVNSFGMEWIIGKGKPLLRKEAVWLVLISLTVVLVGATLLALISAIRPEVSSGVAAGIDANSARWAALGATYAPDYEAIATVNSARWAALGDYYYSPMARSLDASSARWAALGATYAPDYEAIATVNSARWAALGEWYADRMARGD